MKQIGERINRIFGSNMIFFMAAAMLIGWFANELLSQFRMAVPFMFGFMTLVTAVKTSWKDLRSIFKSPLPLLCIVLLQHILMPFFAQFLGNLGFSQSPALITGFILASALPVGITAVIWTGMSEGDVALSLTSATLDTILSPITVSLVLLMFVGQSVTIDYSAIMGSLLLMIVVPSVVGLSINDYSGGSFSKKYNAFLGPVSSLCLCGVIAVNVATAQSTASSMVNAAPILIAFSFTLVLSGFLLGWLISYLCGFTSRTRIASIYCVGIKNTSCGLVIAIGHLPVEASIPLLIAMFFQQPLAALSQKIFMSSKAKD